MFELGDEIQFKNIKGIIIDLESEVIFDDNHKYYVLFENSIFLDQPFEDIEDIIIYLEIVNSIEEDIIDLT